MPLIHSDDTVGICVGTVAGLGGAGTGSAGGGAGTGGARVAGLGVGEASPPGTHQLPEQCLQLSPDSAHQSFAGAKDSGKHVPHMSDLSFAAKQQL